MSTITPDEAKEMVEAYLENPKALLIPGLGKILKGVNVPLEDLEALVNNDDVDRAFVTFAVSEDDLEKPPLEQTFTIILCGINEDDEIIPETLSNKYNLCPPVCPKNFSDIF